MALLPVTKQILSEHPFPNSYRLLVLQHGLRDTADFLRSALDAGFEVGTFIAKPNSVNEDALDEVRALGISIICEPYKKLENTDILDKLLVEEANKAVANNRQLLIVDVGGYFCQPLLTAAKNTLECIKGVVEVTTFGDNRYKAKADSLPIPVVSIARSPLKEAEAEHVGEAVVQATEDVFRELGLVLNGKFFGVIGYGMIGSRIAASLQRRNHRVCTVDKKKSLMLQAKLANFECIEFHTMLKNCNVVFSSTATQTISRNDLKGACDSIVLVSGGSKANEFDVEGIKREAIEIVDTASEHAIKYKFSDGESCILINDGKAANFLKGGSPEEVMDIVFAEQADCLIHLSTRNLRIGEVLELPGARRDIIAGKWIETQSDATISYLKDL